MSLRLDVRRMLLRRGWTEGADLMLRKNGALWTTVNHCGDSGLDSPNRTWSVAFDSGVPARVIAAACEAAAQRPPKPHPATTGETETP
jgi:hypothetical protein